MTEEQINPTESETESKAEEKTVENQDIENSDMKAKEISEDSSGQNIFDINAPKCDEEEEIIIDIEDLSEYDEYSVEERLHWESRYAETMKVFKSHELVNGKIVSINDSDVAVDIGFKSEGNISVEEFDNLDKLKVGDEIEVLIDSIENKDGTLVLSKRKAEFTRTWENINTLYQTGEMIEAPIARRIKGGMVVDLFGIEAFLPGSQIDVHPVRDFDALVGVSMDFRIIKVNNARKNVVLSHKVLVEESLLEIREKVLADLQEGQVVEGIVKNITDFGVFVDLGGVDGLLHITDLSWGRVSHPSDVVTLDEKIKVKVLRFDQEKMRISLGLKQLHEHHWDDIETNFPVESKFKGKVVSIVKYGSFVELEEGVEGLVHISEMSWTQHIRHPSQMVNIGDEVEVVVLNIDRENRKISLGMKQVEEDPWERLEKVFLPETRHNGVVRDLVPFGAFVELEPGIDGLIHISDLSWVRKVRHPGEIVKKGQEIEIIILNFDRNERRIALGLKQLEADPWDSFEREYPIRAHTEGSVIRVLEKGVVVMLPMGVEGFVPNSQLGKSISGENKKNIHEGDNLELEVIEFDKGNHRIVLSHSIVERQKDRSTYRAYKDPIEDSKKTTMSDLMHGTGAKEMLAKVDPEEKSVKKTDKKAKPEVEPIVDEEKKEESKAVMTDVESSDVAGKETDVPSTDKKSAKKTDKKAKPVVEPVVDEEKKEESGTSEEPETTTIKVSFDEPESKTVKAKAASKTDISEVSKDTGNKRAKKDNKAEATPDSGPDPESDSEKEQISSKPEKKDIAAKKKADDKDDENVEPTDDVTAKKENSSDTVGVRDNDGESDSTISENSRKATSKKEKPSKELKDENSSAKDSQPESDKEAGDS